MCASRQQRPGGREDEADPGPDLDAHPTLLDRAANLGGRGAAAAAAGCALPPLSAISTSCRAREALPFHILPSELQSSRTREHLSSRAPRVCARRPADAEEPAARLDQPEDARQAGQQLHRRLERRHRHRRARRRLRARYMLRFALLFTPSCLFARLLNCFPVSGTSIL